MRSLLMPLLASALCTGCTQPNQDFAKLQADLAAAQAKVAILEGELDRAKDINKKIAPPKSRLVVVRGLRLNWEYPIHEGRNFIGRADQQPVDIDLQPQEPDDRVWASRQHALIECNGGSMTIEDLNTANGTYVNRERVPPGQKRKLQTTDVIQIGEVQLKVIASNK